MSASAASRSSRTGPFPGTGPIFNAGAVFHDGRFHLFARGVRDHYRRNGGSGARFLDYVSDILVFTSPDGRFYEFQQRARRLPIRTGSTPGRTRGCTVFAPATAEHFVMTYTNLPPPDANEFWRIGVHRLDYADGGFSLEQGSGQVIGPPGEPDKDGIVFNLRDGRVALIHRIYPNMQLAVFDSLEQLWDPPAGYWEDHMADLERHTIIRPLDTSLGVGAGAPPIVTDDGLAAPVPRARRTRALQHQGGAARPRHRRGHVAARRADHVARSSTGSAGAT